MVLSDLFNVPLKHSRASEYVVVVSRTGFQIQSGPVCMYRLLSRVGCLLSGTFDWKFEFKYFVSEWS